MDRLRQEGFVDGTVRRLELEFVAKDIMIPKGVTRASSSLKYALSQEQARELLIEYPDFDIIPIERDGELAEFINRKTDDVTSISRMYLVSENTPLLSLFEVLQRRGFCFVLEADSITGYIHNSDLNNRLTGLCLFYLIHTLEMRLVEELSDSITMSNLGDFVKQYRIRIIEKAIQRAVREKTNLACVNLLNLNETLHAAQRLGRITITDEMVDSIYDVRNKVYHSRPLVMRHSDIKELISVKNYCIRQIRTHPMS